MNMGSRADSLQRGSLTQLPDSGTEALESRPGPTGGALRSLGRWPDR